VPTDQYDYIKITERERERTALRGDSRLKWQKTTPINGRMKREIK
jgi:hypothetical protein